MVKAEGSLRIGVIGLGLIGGSLALALHDAGHHVIAYDSDSHTRDLAAGDGLQIASTVDELIAVKDLDLVILSVPLRAFAQVLATLSRRISSDTVIMDVGSVKQAVQLQVEVAGLAHHFVGAHPMSGTERSGYGAGNADLMRHVQWVLTPTERSPAAGTRRVLELITADLDGYVSIHDPRAHDELVARISHVPHLVASALLTSVGESPEAADALRLAAGSYRNGTRVAGTAPARTAAMIEENQPAVLAALDGFISHISALRDAVAGSGEIQRRLEFAVEARELFDEVSGAVDPSNAQTVPINWAAPGWLTQLRCGAMGVRIIGCGPAGIVTVE